MEHKIFKRKASILSDIIGRLFLAAFFMFGHNSKNSDPFDWVLLVLTILMGISIAMEITRLFKPLLVFKSSNYLVYKGLLNTSRLANVSFYNKLGQNWIQLRSDQNKVVGYLLVKDLDPNAIQDINHWVKNIK